MKIRPKAWTAARAAARGSPPPPAIQDPPLATTPPPSGASPERQQRSIQIPHLPDPADWAMVQARFPMSEQEWDSMIAVLQSMKIGLVKKPDAGESTSPSPFLDLIQQVAHMHVQRPCERHNASRRGHCRGPSL